jgi:hypothetical protein
MKKKEKRKWENVYFNVFLLIIIMWKCVWNEEENEGRENEEK